MKPNGKKFATRCVFFVMCVVVSLVAVGNAETAHGTFKLSSETHWGRILLAPGEYEFTVDTTSNGKIVIVRSKDSGWSGMIMSESVSALGAPSSNLELGTFEGGTYVRELCLSDLGVTLDFAAPRSSRSVALVKSKGKTTISAAGLQ
jgi:hypothetical protein